MNKMNNIGYSCVVFFSFSVSFLILSIINIILPISDFKMTILSVVSMLLSIQQMLEIQEDVEIKVCEIDEKTTNQRRLLDCLQNIEDSASPKKRFVSKGYMKSRCFFALAMITLVLGLALELDFSYSALANTMTVFSFAIIFFTMAYRERFSARIDRLNDRLYEIDQQIIIYQQERIQLLQEKLKLPIKEV